MPLKAVTVLPVPTDIYLDGIAGSKIRLIADGESAPGRIPIPEDDAGRRDTIEFARDHKTLQLIRRIYRVAIDQYSIRRRIVGRSIGYK